MTALSDVITGVRYDLRDTDSTQYVDAELVVYANRARVQLDAALGSINSEWVSATGTLSLSSGDNYVALPSDFASDRSIWYGSNRMQKKSVGWIVAERLSSSSGLPYYWAVNGLNVLFERDADTDYSFTIHYNSKQPAWTTASTMPYNDEFNDSIAMMIAFQAKSRNELGAATEASMFNYLRDAALQKAVRRNFVPKRRRLDF